MGYVCSSQLDRSREIFSLVVNGAIDRVCRRISKRDWDEIKFLGCLADCDPMFSQQAARDLITPRLEELQFTSAHLNGVCAEVMYVARDQATTRLAPTDKAGLLIESVYSPVRVEISKPLTLMIEWKNFFAVDESAPLDSEIRRLQACVDAGQMTKDQMVSAVSNATSRLGINLC